jgi:transcriptional regulator with AAA-type ATPase domain
MGNIRQLKDFVNRVCLQRLMMAENKSQAIELLADDLSIHFISTGII